jgi:hypothetical protein
VERANVSFHRRNVSKIMLFRHIGVKSGAVILRNINCTAMFHSSGDYDGTVKKYLTC